MQRGLDNRSSFRALRYAGLTQLPDSFRALFRTAGATSVFLTEPWFRNFAETVAGNSSAITVYAAETAASGVPAAALLTWGPQKPSSSFAPRKMEGLSNYYTALFGLLIDEREPSIDAVCRTLAHALWQDRRDWDVIDLKPLDAAARWFAPLADALRDTGSMVQTYYCHANWYLDVAGRTYADYVAGLSSVLRKNIPYSTRRLERSGGSIKVLTKSGPELETAIEQYKCVYGASWKVLEPYPSFMPGLIRTAAQEGWLRLGLAYIEGEPAAAQVWLVHGDAASIFKIAYDQRFAKLSVGTVLTAHLMNHAISVDGVRIVDYLSGDDDYKRNWMSHRRERHGILAINPRSLRGVAQAVRHFGGALIKGKVPVARSQGSRPSVS